MGRLAAHQWRTGNLFMCVFTNKKHRLEQFTRDREKKIHMSLLWTLSRSIYSEHILWQRYSRSARRTFSGQLRL